MAQERSQNTLDVIDEIEPETPENPEVKDSAEQSDDTENRNVIIDDYDTNFSANLQISRSSGIPQKATDIKVSDISASDHTKERVITHVDLNEAEAIANEDILLLADDDLIEELDIKDLIPLEEVNDIHTDTAIGKTVEQPVAEHKKRISPANDKTVVSEPVTTTPREIDIVEYSNDENEIQESGEIIDLKESETKPDTGSDEILKDQLPSHSIPENEVRSDEIAEEETPSFETTEKSETDIAGAIVEKKEFEQVKTDRTVFDYSRFETIIPDELKKIGFDNESVHFLDTGQDETNQLPITIDEQGELERISNELEDILESEGTLLTEGDVKDDRELRYDIYTTTATFEELLFDFEDVEYKYRDDELDFIDNSIIQEDYSQYIREIDDYYGLDAQQTSSKTAELFKLTSDELDYIEDVLFSDEYQGIDLNEMFDLVNLHRTESRESTGKKVNVTYILPRTGSLDEDDKFSIEEEISSGGCLVYEEDVEVIQKILNKPVILPEVLKKTDKTTDISEVVEDLPVQLESEQIEQIEDITNQIVILEDELDVDRFIKTIDSKKQKELKNLLKYLDGLFEKLPENTIRTFADSEYFDLYVKVMNEIGV